MRKDKLVAYANKLGYEDIEKIGEWKEFIVYELIYGGIGIPHIGIPQFLLLEGDAFRISSQEESFAIMDTLQEI